MITYIVLMVLSTITSFLFTYFFELYNDWWKILLMVVAILGFYVIYFILYMLFLVIVILFSTSRKKEVKKPHKLHLLLMHELMFFLMRYSRIKMKVTGLKKVPKGRVMVICNHKSNFDPMPLMYYIKPASMAAVTKPENIKVPIYGKYMHNMGFIRMPKDNNVDSVKAIIKASNYIKNDISSVLIFPEGKRNFEDTTLDFHPGSFKIATKAKVPVVPVTLVGMGDIFEDHYPRLKRAPVVIEFGEPIETADMDRNAQKELPDKVRDLMMETYHRNSALIAQE